MKIVIDTHAGPCPGVRRALKMLEHELKQHGQCVALGEVIHNRAEVARLKESGLDSVDQERVEAGDLSPVSGKRVFIRSHGISEKLRRSLERANVTIIDGVCPTVLQVQKKICDYFEQGFQILIIGKPGHPEVKGLCGAADDRAIVIASRADFARIDPKRKTLLVAQTTIDAAVFHQYADELITLVADLTVVNTLCRQVSKRHKLIRAFAAQVDVLLLVGGKNSSNTRVLHQAASAVHPRTHWIESAAELLPAWFSREDVVGITGSASTPVWQLEGVRNAVEQMDDALIFLKESPLRGINQ